jgi:hypothetical protein
VGSSVDHQCRARSPAAPGRQRRAAPHPRRRSAGVAERTPRRSAIGPIDPEILHDRASPSRVEKQTPSVCGEARLRAVRLHDTPCNSTLALSRGAVAARASPIACQQQPGAPAPHYRFARFAKATAAPRQTPARRPLRASRARRRRRPHQAALVRIAGCAALRSLSAAFAAKPKRETRPSAAATYTRSWPASIRAAGSHRPLGRASGSLLAGAELLHGPLGVLDGLGVVAEEELGSLAPAATYLYGQVGAPGPPVG